ncbi:uncharacterized protein LOC131684331 [Topomyia yanbarensis]|uniref:uncharacterized protein LOC131684331 n=1 Tax=Topomyia yanbarensis TaxID=2498891 RepID=UPI00273B6645|nr:uncharacterized protein LOC131684331 [Topomyia yanbarensis]
MSVEFGEIIEPSTRAFWDDYDESEDGAAPLLLYEWDWLNEDNTEQKIDNVKLLLILEGQAISSFVGTAVLKGRSPICRLNNGSTSIYYNPDKATLICLSEEKDLNNFGRITEKLVHWLGSAEQVAAISFQPSVMHKGTSSRETEEACFIRAINGQVKTIPELEAPNVIAGISAGALSYRKFKDLEASAYVCYLDSSVLDSVSTKPILRLLNSLSVDCDLSYQLKFVDGSNLYV